ncbi:hypothetical protein EfmAA290_20250 [Enterococcus faecium]|nr:hypothetical protein EfmAA290_20250 [Enterococcus faecium]
MTSDSTEIVTFFVISDSAGETATKLAQATMAQYPTVEFNLFRRTFVTDEKKLRPGIARCIRRKSTCPAYINQSRTDRDNTFFL